MLPLSPDQLATLSKLRKDYAQLSEIITCLEFIRNNTFPITDLPHWKSDLHSALSFYRQQQMECRVKIVLIQKPDATLYDLDKF